MTESTNSTIYRLDESSLDKSAVTEDSINSESSTGTSMMTLDSLSVEDFSGFTAPDLETDRQPSDLFDRLLYHLSPLQDSINILFYNKGVFKSFLTVLSKQFSFPSPQTKKFQVKTYVDKSKCLIGIDTVVMSICAGGPGHTAWMEKCFKPLTVNIYRNVEKDINTVLSTTTVNDTLSTSQISTHNPDGNEIVINETAEENEPQPPTGAASPQEQTVFTHLQDSPVIRKISVLMDMISAMQKEMAKLTKEVNILVQQHAAHQTLYRTVDETSTSSPNLNQTRQNQQEDEVPHKRVSREVPAKDGDTSVVVVTPNIPDRNLLSPSSALPDLQTRQYSEVARRTSTPREHNQTPHRPRPDPQPQAPSSSARPAPRTSNSDPDQILLIGDSIISSINPKGLKQNVIKTGISGANIDRLTSQVKVYDIRKFSHLIIYIGGNDASSGTDIEYFEHKYDQLIQYIKDTNEKCKIVLCNICPRGDTSTSEMNDIISTLADHHGACVIDQDKAFHNKYGKVIENYYDNDCIHLSSSGVKRLLGTINNEISVVHEFDKCVYTKGRGTRAPTRLMTQSTRRRNQPIRPRESQRPTSERQRSNERTVNSDRPRNNNVSQQESLRLCYKCGESNHDTSSCKHRQQLKCFHCGFLGHKSGRCLQVA